jgi:hypothetical protein
MGAPFFFFTEAVNHYSETVRHTLLFKSKSSTNSVDLLTDLARFHPIEFARAPNGYVYMATGLNEVVKWNGITSDIRTVGVEAPATAPTLAFTGSGQIEGQYAAYVRYIDADGNYSNLSPVSDVVTATGNGTVLYSDVPVSTDAKVIGRQILRNTAGQFLVFYVDIATTDLTKTSFESTRTDSSLRSRPAVPLYNTDFTVELALLYGIPPNDKPLIAFYQNRLWLYGEVSYEEGSCQVTFGSTTVQGIGTQWTAEMAERVLYIEEANNSYAIESVDKTAQTLTLGHAYVDSTDLFANYKIRSSPERRHFLFFSEAGLYDSWPENQGLDIASADDIDDEGTGLASSHSYLYILQRRHIYRLSYLKEPTVDGGVFLAARRGCVNNRSWVSVDGYMYCLDDRGIYRFDGTDEVEDLSSPIQDLFYFNREPEDIRINWDGARWFHASLDRSNSTIRWFVAFSGEYLPRHAICFNYAVPQWWIEEFPFALGDSTMFKSIASLPITAGKYRKVFALQMGNLDIASETEGDTRADVVAWTKRSVTAITGTIFPATGIVGSTVAIVDGRGKGQWRLISAVSAEKLTVAFPWTVVPDASSTIQIGAMPWKWKSGWNQWPIQEMNQPRRIAVGFQPSGTPNKMDLRVYADYAKNPIDWSLKWPRNPSEGTGITTMPDDPDAEIDLEQEKGFSYLTLDGFNIYDEFRGDIVAAELRGFSGQQPVIVNQIRIQGAVDETGRRR